MSVKTTQEITRAKAVSKYTRLRTEIIMKRILSEPLLMGNDELESELEKMDDELHDGESYRNYSIID